MRYHYFLLVLLVFFAFRGRAQERGYRIEVRIAGTQDTTFYLAHYFGSSTYIDDTARRQQNTVVFQGDSALARGVYMLVDNEKKKILDFPVDDSQHFTISTDAGDIIHKSSATGSPENQRFFDYLKLKVENYSASDSIRQKIKEKTIPKDSMEYYTYQMKHLVKVVKDFEEQTIREHPEWLMSKFIAMMKDVDMTEIEKKTKQKNILYQYYKKHYWDEVDLNDERLLYTPTFHQKLKQYLERVTYQQPDSIIRSIELFIPLIKSQKIFKYVVQFLTYEYANSKIMGFDAVYVHMADHYYASGKAFWADSVIVANVTQKAGKLRRILIGKKAPNLILVDSVGNLRSLYDLQSGLTLLFFYDPDCGHCKKEATELKAWADTTKFQLKIFAVAAKKDRKKWMKFVHSHRMEDWINVNGTTSVTEDFRELYDINSYPQLFLLDGQKKIIAKDIRTKQLQQFLSYYEGRKIMK